MVDENKDFINPTELLPLIAFGDTDDVPNTFDPEAQSTPESSAVLPDIKKFSTVESNAIYLIRSKKGFFQDSANTGHSAIN